MITPYGGIRRKPMDFVIGGVLANPAEIKIDVYVNGLNTADAVLSAAVTASIAQAATGLYHYAYSVAGLAAASQIREMIWIKVLSGDAWTAVRQNSTTVVMVAQATGLTGDCLNLKLIPATC